jgi:NAD(P)-dependent dehydrogenase (short-subunit alcohol dehydrogenase family)
MELKNKVALITGGSQGIGEAIARKFAAAGAKCAVVASSDVKKAEKVAKAIKGGARAYVANVAKPAEVARLVEKVISDFGRIDILVNAAGVFYPTPAGETKTADMNRMVDTNLKGTWNVVNAVVPHMKKQGAGNIVNMASVAGNVAIPTYPIYCATKAGIIMMTKALSVELARSGIHVNAIAPGNTETPMNADIRTDPELKPVLDFMAMLTPSGRTYSTADEMANVALFLASPVTGKPMHGAVITADEGFGAGLFVAS